MLDELRMGVGRAIVVTVLARNLGALVGVHAEVTEQQAAAEHEDGSHHGGSRGVGAEDVQEEREDQTADNHAEPEQRGGPSDGQLPSG